MGWALWGTRWGILINVLQMDYRWNSSGAESSMRESYKRHEKEEDLFSDDFNDDFRLPINHRPMENVDLDNVEQASEDTELSSSNIGFRLLQKMGWKGKGLGKDEQGMCGPCYQKSCIWRIDMEEAENCQSFKNLGRLDEFRSEKMNHTPSLFISWCIKTLNYLQAKVGIIEPIKSGIRDPKLGIGKQEEDDYFTAEENIQRRKLDIEVEETEEVVRKREVMAEREQKIQTTVKEIRKVFFCELCNKQYKLAMEFEAHLSSYDHDHRKRFKEMREMHGSNRDDRVKREQQRQEREMAKFAQMADARKQQQLQEREQSGGTPVSNPTKGSIQPADSDQRKALKFGFSAKSGTSKASFGIAAKKPKLPVASVFGNDSDEEHS
ncbi:hypothetical protein Cgig2_022868 [Carnegiea gigantea]|uniref:G-patch domain-containing protein n=1 Tax=Carnegiea gigantea TaxID=171969 RepID=A0A9Q1KP56_9CARY|nr:hypothetical protein Cgig2_022868 [Carnegiea gigantea]